jgi:hypothetical protein
MSSSMSSSTTDENSSSINDNDNKPVIAIADDDDEDTTMLAFCINAAGHGQVRPCDSIPIDNKALLRNRGVFVTLLNDQAFPIYTTIVCAIQYETFLSKKRYGASPNHPCVVVPDTP